MARQVIMPQMGFDMQEGRLVRWLKQPGDAVEKGDALAEIETDKATVELEAFESGRLAKLLVEEGATVPVGEPVALLEPLAAAQAPPTLEGREVDGAARQPAPTREPAPEGTPAAAPPSPPPPPAEPAPRGISRVARQMAAEQGVDPATLQGRGPGGRILSHDVEEAARQSQAQDAQPAITAGEYRFVPRFHDPAHYLGEAAAPQAQRLAGQTLGEHPFAQPPATTDPETTPPAGDGISSAGEATPAPASPTAPSPAPAEIKPWSRMRRTIARRMSQSKREIPHFYESVQVLMDQALAFRVDLNRELPDEDRITVNDLLVRASALALEEFPNLNGTYTDEGLRINPTVDVAIAVAVEDGLLTPVVRDCNGKGLVELAREVHRVVRAARKGRLKPDEYAGGTFTLSNLGMFGVEAFSAIINPPQTAILAAGGARQQPWVVDGQIQPATVMTLTLAADHRVTDGVEVARFLNRIRELLEHPWLLVNPHLAR